MHVMKDELVVNFGDLSLNPPNSKTPAYLMLQGRGTDLPMHPCHIVDWGFLSDLST